MAQFGNIYTGKFRDIASTYLTPHHMYFAYDTKELYSFNPDQTPYKLFNQDNITREIRIPANELPTPYTKDDVLVYLNTTGIDKEDIETLVIEVVGGQYLGEGSYNTLVDWNSITNKPTTFAPSPHTHSYNDLTDKPDLTNPIDESEIKQIIRDFTVGGDGIDLVYDEVEDVLRFIITGEVQENVNIVIDINEEDLISKDDAGITYFLNNLNPPLLIEPQHNIYIHIVSSEAKQFDYPFDFKLG